MAPDLPAGAGRRDVGSDAILIRNPTAGRPRRARRAAAVAAALREGGWRVEERTTTAPGEATRIASEAAAAGVAAVFVLGGDGTLREAAAGLLAVEPEGGPPARGPALGVLPGGTTNVLAHSLGLPPDPVAAARAHDGSARRPFDVGLCGDTPFLLMVSAGLDAHAVARVAPALKRRLGKFGLAITGIREWWRYGFPPIAVTADGEAIPPVTFAAVCNIPHYGGPFAMAPAARWDDGRLDLVVHRGTGRWSNLRFDLAVARGRHLDRPDAAARTAREVVLDGPPGLCLQVDGDPCPEPLPATVRVVPGCLPVLVPGAIGLGPGR